MSTFHRIPIFSILVASFLVGCGPVDDRKEVKEERVLPSGHEAPELRKSMRERFTMGEMVGMEDPNAGNAEAGGEEDGGEGENLADFLDWKLPEGWKEVTPTDMRLINLRFGEGDEGECFLTLLPGGGGGMAANVGRWYGQMGKPAPDQAAIDALPRESALGEGCGRGRFGRNLRPWDGRAAEGRVPVRRQDSAPGRDRAKSLQPLSEDDRPC